MLIIIYILLILSIDLTELNTEYVDDKPFRRLLNTNLTLWVAPLSPRLPRPDRSMAIAAYNNTIFLFGGEFNPKQMVQFDVRTGSITDFGVSAFQYTFGYSQYYTQINELFYWIDGTSGHYIPTGYVILTYNLITKQISQCNGTMVPNVGLRCCLASNTNYLFAVGGSNLNTLHIYHIESMKWSSGPLMQTTRAYHSCIVYPESNTLYAIGGSAGDGSTAIPLKSIETIFIDNINNQHWIYTQDLLYTVNFAIAILYQESILLIGGTGKADQSQPFSAIQVIDCSNGQVTFGGNLSYAVSRTSAILINHQIYVFGGLSHGNIYSDSAGTLDIWQYLDLLTQPSTDEPSIYPTMFPTDNPAYIYHKSTATDSNCERIGLFLSLTWNTISGTNSLCDLVTKNKTEFNGLLKDNIYTFYDLGNNYISLVTDSLKCNISQLDISHNITNCNSFANNLIGYLNSTSFIITFTNNMNEHYYNNNNNNNNTYIVIKTVQPKQYHSFLPHPIDLKNIFNINNPITILIFCLFLFFLIIITFGYLHNKH
eukprot:6005_1